MIWLNDQQVAHRRGQTLGEVLVAEGYVLSRVAVLCNGVVVRQGELSTHPLAAGDRLEVLHFVGGG